MSLFSNLTNGLVAAFFDFVEESNDAISTRQIANFFSVKYEAVAAVKKYFECHGFNKEIALFAYKRYCIEQSRDKEDLSISEFIHNFEKYASKYALAIDMIKNGGKNELINIVAKITFNEIKDLKRIIKPSPTPRNEFFIENANHMFLKIEEHFKYKTTYLESLSVAEVLQELCALFKKNDIEHPLMAVIKTLEYYYHNGVKNDLRKVQYHCCIINQKLEAEFGLANKVFADKLCRLNEQKKYDTYHSWLQSSNT